MKNNFEGPLINPILSSESQPSEIKLSPEQEAGLKYFERAKKMEAAAVQLREMCAAMSEPYPEIDPDKKAEIYKIFEQIGFLSESQVFPNIEQLFLEETQSIYWEKIADRLGVEQTVLRKMFNRLVSETMLKAFLSDFNYSVFGSLTFEDMHEIWFYNQIGEKIPDSRTSFDKWMKINGVPAIFSGNLVVSEKLWNKKINYNDKTLGEIITGGELGQGCYFPVKNIDSSNPLEVLGLSVIKEQKNDKEELNKEKIMLTALHEGTHQIDFHQDFRLGDDRLIGEILAFRSKIWNTALNDVKEKQLKMDLISVLRKKELKQQEEETNEEFELRQKKIGEAVLVFKNLKEKFSPDIARLILFNCQSLTDLIAWSFKLENEDEIKQYTDWKKEKVDKKQKRFNILNLIYLLQDCYLEKKKNETDEQFEARKNKIEEAVIAYNNLEGKFDSAIVQHILLNCLTLDDLIAWDFKLETEEDIEKYTKWKENVTKKEGIK